jgi:hypothetical protein
MSTSQTHQQIEEFKLAKTAFLHHARAARIIGGLVQGVREMDQALVRTVLALDPTRRSEQS